MSLASAIWAGDRPMALGQSALYGLAILWAIALAWSLEGRDVPRLLWGYVAIATLGSALCILYYYETQSVSSARLSDRQPPARWPRVCCRRSAFAADISSA